MLDHKPRRGEPEPDPPIPSEEISVADYYRVKLNIRKSAVYRLADTPVPLSWLTRASFAIHRARVSALPVRRDSGPTADPRGALSGTCRHPMHPPVKVTADIYSSRIQLLPGQPVPFLLTSPEQTAQVIKAAGKGPPERRREILEARLQVRSVFLLNPAHTSWGLKLTSRPTTASYDAYPRQTSITKRVPTAALGDSAPGASKSRPK